VEIVEDVEISVEIVEAVESRVVCLILRERRPTPLFFRHPN
jgi:hypothetical protein